MKITVKNIVILFLILTFLSGFIVISNNSINSSQTLKTSCPNTVKLFYSTVLYHSAIVTRVFYYIFILVK